MSWDSAAVEAYLVQLGKVQHTIQYWGEEAMVVSEDKTNVVSAGVLVRMKTETFASVYTQHCTVANVLWSDAPMHVLIAANVTSFKN